ncbi:hypothetical protein BDV95DRAFT_607108 [Massariosphaeria phaeospora]|uniref:Uncharacterized protein n=1 Tax=Massariosphaeria phaeospora TaxID=100035 RepID=A0A7C8I9L9_9PLEO|nr:hypothetical protein BDV95DRAFT_607108 [Massariosphaeria phaeospora]
MSKKIQSYELLHRGPDLDDDEYPEKDVASKANNESINKTDAPFASPKSTLVSTSNETPNVPLNPKIWSLIVGLVLHLIPAVTTLGIIQLSVFNVYWFDNDAESNEIPVRGIKISLTELTNLLQFVAKIHEILMVGSLSAMVIHRVRRRLLGTHGLPFGMLTAGYSVGSAEYLFTRAFRSGFNRKFWSLSVLIFAFTLLASTLGPASAIALQPSLDWWPMKHPFGDEKLPILLDRTRAQWWPLEITKEHTRLRNGTNIDNPEDSCYSIRARTFTECPISGWESLGAWTTANSNDAIAANVSMEDSLSSAQRVIKSRLTDRIGENPGVAITTSVSHTLTTLMGTFWAQVASRDYAVNDVVRPRLELPQDQQTFQPLVQVQCVPYVIDAIYASRDARNASIKTNTGINTFSTRNASEWPVPDWVYDLEYKPPNKLFADGAGGLSSSRSKAVNLTWLEFPSNDNFNLSLAAIVTTPTLISDAEDSPVRQTAMLHFCSIDARWIGSLPSYDPTENTAISHNITDPLLFQKSEGSDDAKYKADVANWGVSPALKLSTQWADALNIPGEVENATAPLFNWLLTPYIQLVSTNDTLDDADIKNGTEVTYLFSPGVNRVENETSVTEFDSQTKATSENIATILGLQLTDALARILLTDIQNGEILTKHVNATHATMAWIGGIAGFDFGGNELNVTLDSIKTDVKTELTFQIQRYGHGYGFRTATTAFGVGILLTHTLLVIIYIVYALYDFFYVSRWTSSAWGDIGSLAALLINSEPTPELQNTCAGIDSKETWRKRVRIRETADGHLGVVVGDDWMTHLPVRTGVEYGTLDMGGKNAGTQRKRPGLRRGSV